MPSIVKMSELDAWVTVATADLLPAAIAPLLAKAARAAKQEVIQINQARGGVAPHVTTSVNGRVGAPEESVKVPGPIIYQFDYLAEIGIYAIAFLKARSPVRNGKYRDSHMIIQHGRYISAGAVVPGVEFHIVNTQPYSRKIELGVMKMRVAPHVYEDARQAIQRRYGNTIRARAVYLELTGGYILKGHGSRRRRKSRAGEKMRYPAILVTPL